MAVRPLTHSRQPVTLVSMAVVIAIAEMVVTAGIAAAETVVVAVAIESQSTAYEVAARDRPTCCLKSFFRTLAELGAGFGIRCPTTEKEGSA